MAPRHVSLTLLVLGLAACARVPYTGRSQVMVVSESQAKELGAQAFAELLKQSRVVKDPAYVAPVRTVGQRIAKVAEERDADWQFAVLDDPKQVNAFALPGGKVGVYTGMFPVARTSAALAVVVAHEVAHVLARHGGERMSQAMLANLGGTVLGAALGGGPGTQAILAAYGLGAQLGVLMPFSRTQEEEADHIGLILMGKAGYDPREAIAFWERMDRAGGGKAPPEFLSTHPSHGTRVENIRQWLAEALPHYERAGKAPVVDLPPVSGARRRRAGPALSDGAGGSGDGGRSTAPSPTSTGPSTATARDRR
jgi:predicted Zn-dependent protease